MFDPRDDKTVGYHLFLEPSAKSLQNLQAIINKLAGASGGPVFVPHLTLLARIRSTTENELIRKTKAVAAQLPSLRINIGELAKENAYYRALYARVIPETAIQEAHIYAKKLFDVRESQEYVPHVSLLYGNYSAKQKKTFEQDCIGIIPTSILLTTLSLWKTKGNTTTWRRVFTIPLQDPA